MVGSGYRSLGSQPPNVIVDVSAAAAAIVPAPKTSRREICMASPPDMTRSIDRVAAMLEPNDLQCNHGVKPNCPASRLRTRSVRLLHAISERLRHRQGFANVAADLNVHLEPIDR